MEPQIVIATPSHTGLLHARTVMGMMATAKQWTCKVDVVMGSYLPHSRDRIITDFLATDNATHLLCVDADIGFCANDVGKLLDADRGMVGGVYLARKPPHTPVLKYTGGKEDGPLLDVEHVGFGLVLLRRAEVEQIVEKHKDRRYQHSGEVHTGLFSPDKPGNSEDVAFCQRWRAMGWNVWVHTDVCLTHVGEALITPQQEQKK